MKRLACVASALAVLVLAAGADKEETQTVKQLMGKLHKGAKAPVNVLKTALKSESPDWKAVKESSKELVLLGAGLPKTEPNKGDKSSYQTLATAYFNDSKALDSAAQAEDKAGAQAALSKLNASCKSCHSVHKGK